MLQIIVYYFHFFNDEFNRNIYYRAQITLTLKISLTVHWHLQKIKKHICTLQCLFFAYYFHFFRQYIKMKHRFFDSRPLQ